METIVKKAKEILTNKSALAVAAGTLAFITVARLYFRGGVCRANRDLRDLVVVITGGSAGIGKETVKVLATKGCTIIFGARDKQKSEKVVKQVMKINKTCNIFFFPLDLADKNSIQIFSSRVKSTCDRIDILINNAGVALPDKRVTKDGFEMTMGVNHLGHFYLTSLLWEKIKISNHPRIINVSSLLAHKQPKGEKDSFIIDLDDMNYDKYFDHNLAYSRSKLANILFARQLQANMDKSGIKGLSLSLHPGVIVTELAREFGIKLTIMKIVFCLFIALCTKSPIQGAQTTLYLVLQEEDKLEKGGYYGDCKLSKRGCSASKNMEYAQRLWLASEKMLGIKFDT